MKVHFFIKNLLSATERELFNYNACFLSMYISKQTIFIDYVDKIIKCK